MALWQQDKWLLWWSSNNPTTYSGSAYATKGNVYRAKKTLRLYQGFFAFSGGAPNTYFTIVGSATFNGSNSSLINDIRHRSINFSANVNTTSRVFNVETGVKFDAGEYFFVLTVNTAGATAVNRVAYPASANSSLYGGQEIEWIHSTRQALANPAISDEIFFSNTTAPFDMMVYGA